MFSYGALELDEIPLSAEKPPVGFRHTQYRSGMGSNSVEHVIESLDIEETARPVPRPIPYPSRLSSDNLNTHLVNPPASNRPNETITKTVIGREGPVAVKITRHGPHQPQAEKQGNGRDSGYGNPERVKYLMKAGHQQRREEAIMSSIIDPESRASPSLSKPAIQSTARIQNEIDQLQAMKFEDDDEAQQEVQRRTKLEEKKISKKINYKPNERRFSNLVSIEATEPASVPRKVPKQVSQQYLKMREAKPDIKDLYDYDKYQPEFSSATSMYVPPSTTPLPVDPRHTTFLAQQLFYFQKGLTIDDVARVTVDSDTLFPKHQI